MARNFRETFDPKRDFVVTYRPMMLNGKYLASGQGFPKGAVPARTLRQLFDQHRIGHAPIKLDHPKEAAPPPQPEPPAHVQAKVADVPVEPEDQPEADLEITTPRNKRVQLRNRKKA